MILVKFSFLKSQNFLEKFVTPHMCFLATLLRMAHVLKAKVCFQQPKSINAAQPSEIFI